MEFLTEEHLLRLYDTERKTGYLTGLFGPFLPTDREVWAEKMAAVQGIVQNRSTMLGDDLHGTIARAMFLIIKGHKLVDGNKRSSILCMIGMYYLNGYEMTIDPEALYRKVKEIAALDSQTCDDDTIVADVKKFLQDGTYSGADTR